MNIFCLHEDPDTAARLMYDEHIRSKMIVESAQMLAFAFDQSILDEPTTPKTQTGKSRRAKTRHYNHPCSKWVRESDMNMAWLGWHAIYMAEERRRRWLDIEPHFSMDFILWAMKNISRSNAEICNRTPFAVAIKDTCECRKIPGFDCLDTVTKYRLYYELDKPYMTRTYPSVDPAVYFA